MDCWQSGIFGPGLSRSPEVVVVADVSYRCNAQGLFGLEIIVEHHSLPVLQPVSLA